jgi:hypothetical protein
VLIVAAVVEDDGKIRGTRWRGAQARAAVRLLDVATGSVIAEAGDLAAAAHAATPAEALAEAARRLAVIDAAGAALVRRWPAPLDVGDGVVLAVHDAPSWAAIDAITRTLSATPGVQGVTPRHFRRWRVVLDVATRLRTEEIARLLGAAALEDLALHVTPLGQRMLRVDVIDGGTGEPAP